MTKAAPFRPPFIRHPWPYPSGVCLLSNLARVLVLGRQDLAALWLSGPRARQLADQLGGLRHWVGSDSIAASLRLTTAEVPLAFDPTCWWPGALRTFASAFADPLRFCPTCLVQGYHSHLFQLPWWMRCPVHDVDLRSACLHCGGTLTGLRARAAPGRALHCSGCSRSLVNTGALIDAARGTTAERWHAVVAAHRRWAAEISQEFLVAPTLTTPSCELDPEHILGWIHAAGVDWPTEFLPFVSRTRAAPLGLRAQWKVSAKGELHILDPLARRMAEPPHADEPDVHHVTAGSLPAAQALLRLEERLQRASGVRYPRSFTEQDYRGRQRSGEQRIPKVRDFEFDVAAGIRDRGFRRRRSSMHVEGVRGGLVRVSMHRSDLTGLTAVRLLRHADGWLRTVQDLDEGQPAKVLVRWWHAHLLALSLVDSTIAAIQAMGWEPLGCDAHVLPGWPPIHLDRHTPGHAWLLAATYRSGQLTAYIGSVPLSRTIRPDVGRARELHEMLGLDILTFQTLRS